MIMDKIKPIQLPVRYDSKASQLVDAEGSAWLDVDVLDYNDREICEAMVSQIADALNTAADKDRQIAALTERIELLRKAVGKAVKRTQEMHTALSLGDALLVDTKALADFKRIQEGE